MVTVMNYKLRLAKRRTIDFLDKVVEFHDNNFIIVLIEVAVLFFLLSYNLSK
jgi:hypothetical protein